MFLTQALNKAATTSRIVRFHVRTTQGFAIVTASENDALDIFDFSDCKLQHSNEKNCAIVTHKSFIHISVQRESKSMREISSTIESTLEMLFGK